MKTIIAGCCILGIVVGLSAVESPVERPAPIDPNKPTLESRIEKLEAALSPKMPPKIKPLNELLIPTRQDWKQAYGDTLQTQIVQNIVILRNNQIEIARMISRLHPPVDPNKPTEVKEGTLRWDYKGSEELEGYFEGEWRFLTRKDPNAPIDPNEVKE